MANDENFVSVLQAENSLLFVRKKGTINQATTVEIYDVQTPAKLVHLSSYSAGDRAVAALELHESLAYILCHGDDEPYWTLTIINLSDPANPQEVGQYNSPDEELPLDFTLYQQSAYVVTDYSFEIIDLSTPSHPVKVANYSYPAGQVKVEDHFAYITWEELTILDLSDPITPVPVGHTPITKHTLAGMAVLLGYVVMAFWWHGLQVYNVTDPTNPTIVDNYSFPDRESAPGGTAHAIQIEGQKAVVAGRDLNIFDLSTPKNIQRVTRYLWIGREHTYSLAVSQGYIYLETEGMIRIFSFTKQQIVWSYFGAGVLVGVVIALPVIITLLRKRYQWKKRQETEVSANLENRTEEKAKR
ncbi:MAG: hypothetical protein GF308_07460 [Candidatus Heimdallarchaeota archaeon]|nr:hypothetical protein [Candidatus Heimdallarchaeota archaeon]